MADNNEYYKAKYEFLVSGISDKRAIDLAEYFAKRVNEVYMSGYYQSYGEALEGMIRLVRLFQPTFSAADIERVTEALLKMEKEGAGN